MSDATYVIILISAIYITAFACKTNSKVAQSIVDFPNKAFKYILSLFKEKQKDTTAINSKTNNHNE